MQFGIRVELLSILPLFLMLKSFQIGLIEKSPFSSPSIDFAIDLNSSSLNTSDSRSLSNGSSLYFSKSISTGTFVFIVARYFDKNACSREFSRYSSVFPVILSRFSYIFQGNHIPVSVFAFPFLRYLSHPVCYQRHLLNSQKIYYLGCIFNSPFIFISSTPKTSCPSPLPIGL